MKSSTSKATDPKDTQPTTDEPRQEKSPRTLSNGAGEVRTRSLRHLFGPVVLVAIICLPVIAISLLWPPDRPTDYLSGMVKCDKSQSDHLLKVFDNLLKDYKTALVKLDTYLGFQAVLIATWVLVIIRR
jgi:hypothetical protein